MGNDSTTKAAKDRMGRFANHIQTSLRIILKKKKTRKEKKKKGRRRKLCFKGADVIRTAAAL